MVQGEQFGGQTFCGLGLPVNSLCIDLHLIISFTSTCPSKGKNLTSPCLGIWAEWIYLQFSSVAQSCLILCDPMNRSMPGLPVHHQLPESTQTHVHRVYLTLVFYCEYLFSTYYVAGTAFGTRGLMFNANKYIINNLYMCF